ncbi:hypothetical protein RND81_05G015500 [Saponaria officinalis]|uniref:Plant bHLH transcription factor ACT-like domain-containing protein n=1 Tax=Saponaria officinalis TaxID=3572 RepID=A0AAW1KQ68_SAPOF
MSREKNSNALQRKYNLLSSLTNSNSKDKVSILKDASKYIKELKQKVERLNQDIGTSCSNQISDPLNTTNEFDDQNLLPQVNVETREEEFVINVCSDQSCQGLLVIILKTFEQLGLEVRDANVSCDDCFQLDALGVEKDGVDDLDAQIVRQAILQAVIQWKGDK